MSKKKIEYIKITNFTNNGDLGIGIDVVKEIARQGVNEVQGASLFVSKDPEKQSITATITKKGEIFVSLAIAVAYGYNVSEICQRVQERIEHNMLYMIEKVPQKIDVSVGEVAV